MPLVLILTDKWAKMQLNGVFVIDEHAGGRRDPTHHKFDCDGTPERSFFGPGKKFSKSLSDLCPDFVDLRWTDSHDVGRNG